MVCGAIGLVSADQIVGKPIAPEVNPDIRTTARGVLYGLQRGLIRRPRYIDQGVWFLNP